jgi:glycosyl hydrolase family 2
MKKQRVDLGGQWLRRVGEADIDFVTVPGSYPPLGESTLSRSFELPWKASESERFFLCTEGVLARARFVLNGKEIGVAGPWATYRFEFPAELLQTDNVIEAEIRDIVEDFGPTPGRRFDAGLVRPIWIERRSATFLEDMSFQANLSEDGSRADCTVRVELDGPEKPEVELVLSERDTGRVVASAIATNDAPARLGVDFPRPWTPDTPNLYTLTATLANDPTEILSENVGFRRLEVRGRDFFLNGERLLLKGVCRHEFTHASGYSPSEDEVRREMAAIRHAGFNYVRLVHSPHARCVCRIAAELGLLVSEEPGTCFHDLSDPGVYAPAFEALRRTVKRDRNVPSILAWMIYNECNPDTTYAIRAAGVCRELNPGCLLGMADCSGRNDEVKTMVHAADLSFYGINVYSYWPKDYCDRMEIFRDRPLVFTEWGGCMGQGNPRLLADLCESFVIHARINQTLRIAGCSFWAWSDYEEHSRPGPATVDRWTIEGLVDADGTPKGDLQTLSTFCFEMGRTPVAPRLQVEVLSPAPRRDAPWSPIDLESVSTDQQATEHVIEETRRARLPHAEYFIPYEPDEAPLPRIGRVLVDGVEFCCRDACEPAHPLLLGAACEEVVIPVGKEVDAIAALGHVAFQGGYPSSTIHSVHHRDAETPAQFGAPAGEYVFEFDGESITQPLRHGIEILRSNDVCRWWTPQPRAPRTRPALRVVANPRYEVLRLDLWEHRFDAPRMLREVRWRLLDPNAILMLYGLSVRVAQP